MVADWFQGGCNAAIRPHDAACAVAATLEAFQGALAHGLGPSTVLEDLGMDLSCGPSLLLCMRPGPSKAQRKA